MKKFRLLLLFFFVGLFGFINFSSAGSYIIHGPGRVHNISSSSSTSTGTVYTTFIPLLMDGYYDPGNYFITGVSCNIINFDLLMGNLNISNIGYVFYRMNPEGYSVNTTTVSTVYQPFNGDGIYSVSDFSKLSSSTYAYYGFTIAFQYSRPNGNDAMLFEYVCTVEGPGIANYGVLGYRPPFEAYVWNNGNLLGIYETSDGYFNSPNTLNIELTGNLSYSFDGYMSIYISGNSTPCPTIDTAYCTGNNLCPACPSCPSCPNQYTSLECQSEYSLIPVSSVDSNYCENNNLCSSCPTCQECPSYTGDLTPGVSNIFINDVFHPGAFNIIMNIPDEIDWDYTYSNSGSNFNLDVVGYNQDTEYINSLLEVQNYKPTQDDFTNVFNKFGLYGGLLVACLFIILVFYFVKKLFK